MTTTEDRPVIAEAAIVFGSKCSSSGFHCNSPTVMVKTPDALSFCSFAVTLNKTVEPSVDILFHKDLRLT